MNRTKKMRSEAHRIDSSHGQVLRKRTRLRAIARSYNRSLRIVLSTPRSLFPFPVWSMVVRRVALALANEAIRAYERGNCREGQRLLGIVEAMAGGISASVARAQRAQIERSQRDAALTKRPANTYNILVSGFKTKSQVTPPQEGLTSCVYCPPGPRYFPVAA